MNPHDEHDTAVGFAGLHIQNSVIPLLALAMETIENETLGVVAAAVGSNPGSKSGQAAQENVLKVKEELDLLIGHLRAAIEELNNYGKGL